MFNNLSYRFRVGRAYWRTAPFAEMAELYASRFIRIIAQNLVNSFIVVFLYQSGYDLKEIFIIIAGYFIYRGIISFPLAYAIAWLGPKASILLSNIVAVPALIALTFIGEDPVISVIMYFVFEGVSMVLLTIATDVQFSSIKTTTKAGRELGWLTIVEKVAAAIAPIVGGFLAYKFGPQSIMWLSALLMISAAIPLFFSPEHIRRKQHVIYHGFPWHRVGLQMVSPFIRGADNTASGGTWSLFISIYVIGISSNAVYAQLGIFFSISFLASVVASHIYGMLIDRRRGEQLLGLGVFMDIVTHGIRAFTTTPVMIGAVNVMNEAATSAYTMPTVRAQYDMVDDLPGYRVVYFTLSMIFLSFGAAFGALIALGMIYLFGDMNGLKAAFGVAAVMAPLILVHGYGHDRMKR